jgi:hypothetical protein
MLADPVTVAAASPTPELVLSIIRSDNYGSERVDTGANGYSTMINHQTTKLGSRHYVKLTKTVNATNPFTGLVQPKAAAVSMSIFVPDFGFDNTAMVALTTALRDFVFDSEVTPLRLLQFQS